MVFTGWSGVKLNMLIYNKRNNIDHEYGGIWLKQYIAFINISDEFYEIMFLPQWFLTNAIISWITDSKIGLSPFIHIIVYMPLIICSASILSGYVIHRTAERQSYSQI
jgi:hypothetical protein